MKKKNKPWRPKSKFSSNNFRLAHKKKISPLKSLAFKFVASSSLFAFLVTNIKTLPSESKYYYFGKTNIYLIYIYLNDTILYTEEYNNDRRMIHATWSKSPVVSCTSLPVSHVHLAGPGGITFTIWVTSSFAFKCWKQIVYMGNTLCTITILLISISIIATSPISPWTTLTGSVKMSLASLSTFRLNVALNNNAEKCIVLLLQKGHLKPVFQYS